MNKTKQRNRFVTAWLWLILAVNLITSICNIVLLFGKTSVEVVIWSGLGVIISIIAALSAALLLKWNKLGFILFTASTLIYSLIGQFYIWESILLTFINFIPILFLWLVLHLRKNGKSAWSLLKGGVDYRHCRHIYQLFSGLIAISIVCTLIASITVQKSEFEGPIKPVTSVLDEKQVDTSKVDIDTEKQKNDEPKPATNEKLKSKDKHDSTPKLSYNGMSVDQLWRVLSENNKDAEALYRLAKYYHNRNIKSDPKVLAFWKNTLLPEGDVQKCLPSGKRELTSVRFVFVMLARSYANMPENPDPKLKEGVVNMLNSIQNKNSGYRYK